MHRPAPAPRCKRLRLHRHRGASQVSGTSVPGAASCEVRASPFAHGPFFLFFFGKKRSFLSNSQTRNPRPLLIVSVSTNRLFTCTRNPPFARNPILVVCPKTPFPLPTRNPSSLVFPKPSSSLPTRNPISLVLTNSSSSLPTQNPISRVSAKSSSSLPTRKSDFSRLYKIVVFSADSKSDFSRLYKTSSSLPSPDSKSDTSPPPKKAVFPLGVVIVPDNKSPVEKCGGDGRDKVT